MTEEVETLMKEKSLAALVYPGSLYDLPSAVAPVAGLPLVGTYHAEALHLLSIWIDRTGYCTVR